MVLVNVIGWVDRVIEILDINFEYIIIVLLVYVILYKYCYNVKLIMLLFK